MAHNLTSAPFRLYPLAHRRLIRLALPLNLETKLGVPDGVISRTRKWLPLFARAPELRGTALPSFVWRVSSCH